jgi:hypothetical protein
MNEPQDKRRRTHVIREEVKERHTTHWDLDYLPAAEVDKLMRQGRLRRRLSVAARVLIAGLILIVLSAAGYALWLRAA